MTINKGSGVKSRISRRRFLEAGGCALGAVFLGAAAASAQEGEGEEPKKTQQEVAYKAPPANGRQCLNCRNYQKPAFCRIVEGLISPDGWCKLYVMSWSL